MTHYKFLDHGSVTTPRGFRAAGVTAGFKRNGAPDFAMIESEVPANFAGAFTSCTFAAAPVQLCRRRVLSEEFIRAAVINSGNANACTGPTGLANAEATCVLAANRLGIRPEEVVVSSTGRIGVQMPMETVKKRNRTGRRRPEFRRRSRGRAGHHDHRHRAQIGGGRA